MTSGVLVASLNRRYSVVMMYILWPTPTTFQNTLAQNSTECHHHRKEISNPLLNKQIVGLSRISIVPQLSNPTKSTSTLEAANTKADFSRFLPHLEVGTPVAGMRNPSSLPSCLEQISTEVSCNRSVDRSQLYFRLLFKQMYTSSSLVATEELVGSKNSVTNICASIRSVI